MGNQDIRGEIETLAKAIEKSRLELKKTWQKCENLEAAIESAKNNQMQIKQKWKSK